MSTDKLQKAIGLIDAANRQDPNKELFEGVSYAKELLYGQRMTAALDKFYPEASEALQLAVRAQHICRWEIPRSSYEMNRTGYLLWRQELKKYHAKKTSEILSSVGYDLKVVEQVSLLLQKKQMKKNLDTQTLEDVACLVFLEYYFEEFAKKYTEEKIIDIVQKTWRKMSETGQKYALTLSLSDTSLQIITKALQ